MKLFGLISALLLSANLLAQDTAKIMTYNLLNYDVNDTNRNSYFRTVIQNSRPDIVVVEEILSQNAVNTFRDRVMNLSGIGTFAAGTFINGFDSDNAIFFKTTKFAFISNTPINTELRDINEFKVVHIVTGDTLRLYAVHLKAGSTSADSSQRSREVQNLRNVTNTLPLNSNFIVMGDFNFYGAYEPAYVKLLQVISGNEGHFIDMLSMPGIWNNSAYSIYHTQSPRTRAFGNGSTGGMDDRFDLILYSKAVSEQGGITVIPLSMVPYGNDGNHFNDSINRPPNTAVGQTIANALHYASDHLPVYALFKFQGPFGIQQISSNIPERYSLRQNYPNPFNPVTKIEFQLPQAGSIKVMIYDIMGQEISVLAAGYLRPGTYRTEFDAAHLTSGVYFCKLVTENFTETKRMVLVK